MLWLKKNGWGGVCAAIVMCVACQGGSVRPSVVTSPAATQTGNGNTSAGGSSQSGNTALEPVGEACGYQQQGKLLQIADGVGVCQPPSVCTSETCPPPLGACQNNVCVAKTTYAGLLTLPEAWVTYYCQLSTGGCDGVTQQEKPLVTAQKVAGQLTLSLCETASNAAEPCVGIAASSPLVVGNSQLAIDPRTQTEVAAWGLGLSEASDVCYHLVGPGAEAYVALTDRCGGYCRCNGSDYAECGACVNATDMTPQCPCVGSAPGVADACCGAGCSQVVSTCDWCASNNHPHFDLDQATFNHVCGSDATQGSCKLKQVTPFRCPLGVTWPPAK